MATFKELVLATRLLCGMQGTGPSSVVGAIGIEEVLVTFVKDAYIDIQNSREEYGFLQVDKSLTLQGGVDTYTLFDIFGVSAPPFKKYKKNSFRITDSNGKHTYLLYRERDVLEARYLNDTEQKLPTQYAINPKDNSLIFKPIPDGLYTVDFRYYRSPEVLSTDQQVPLLPLSFHNMITYLAASKMGVYLGSPELYQRYSAEADRMLGELMRMEIPKKRIFQRPMV